MGPTQHPRDRPVESHWFGDDFWTRPYPTYRHLRDTGRIHWSDFYGGAWLVPGFEDVQSCLTNPMLSADRSGVPAKRFPEEIQEELEQFTHLFSLWLLFQDPPHHTRVRKLVNRSFTPRVLQSWRPRVQTIVDDLLDRVADRGEMEFMNDFAYRLPAMVIAEMLGVKRDDHDDFIGWSGDLADFFGPPYPTVDVARRAQTSLLSMMDYFRDVIDEKRREPADDVITILVRAEDDEGTLTEDEVLAQCTLFMFAGHETTRNLLGNGLLTLLQHPDQLDALRDDPRLVRGAVDELLRYESPIQFLNRTVIEEGELCGEQLRGGESVVLLLGSANRDEERFTDAGEVRIERDEGNHLAFGFGPHYCLGAPLTHLEGDIAFNTVLQRFPELRLAEPDKEDWDPGKPHFRNLRSLPVRF